VIACPSIATAHAPENATIAVVSSNEETRVGSLFSLPTLLSPRISRCTPATPGSRLNLVIPYLAQEKSYGGATTALRLFERLSAEFTYLRIIATDQKLDEIDLSQWPQWTLDGATVAPRAIASLAGESPLPVFWNEYFLTTSWTTAFYVRRLVKQLAGLFPEVSRRYVYFIQDYEPGFYPFSAESALAESTYHERDSVIAVFNSQRLATYFQRRNLEFPEQYIFEPALHPQLRQKRNDVSSKDRLILVYARPSLPRNAFELIVESLRAWADAFPSASEWSVLSAGASHADIPLGGTMVMRSLGKLSMDEYAHYLSRSWIGMPFIFLAHPGYVRLEMAEFGCWVVTNRNEHDDLADLAPNMACVEQPTPDAVAAKLAWCCSRYQPGKSSVIDNLPPVFAVGDDEFPAAAALLGSWRRTDE
jgi:O-antigen biosynthesis protein